MSWSGVITWLLVGALAGAITGSLFKGKGGYGRLSNLAIGLIGAIIGGGIFAVFRIDLGLGNISVSLQDVIAALIGSVLFVVGLKIYKRRQRRPGG